MADLIPVLTRQTVEPAEYRPLSGLALAGFIIGAAFTILVAVLGAVSFFSGAPLFMGAAVLLVPAVGLALAFAGSVRVRRSEGTVGGAKLATWGWRLCLVAGLAYAGFYMGTYLAVRYQAAAFTQEFFDRLRQGKANHAFVMILDPHDRKYVKPDDDQGLYQRYGMYLSDGQKGALARFQETELVRVLEQGGDSMQVEPLGIKSWNFEKGGYRVTESFRIKTAEGTYAVLVETQSFEDKTLKGRQWQIQLPKSFINGRPQLNSFGEAVWNYRVQSFDAVRSWISKFATDDLPNLYLDTKEQSERKKLVAEFEAQLVLAVLSPGPLGGLPAMASPGLLPERSQQVAFLPGFREFLDGGFVDTSRFQAIPQLRGELIQRTKYLFRDPHSGKFQFPNDGNPLPRSPDPNADHIQILHPVSLGLVPQMNPEGGAPTPKYTVDLYVVVESDRGPITPDRVPTWRVAGLEMVRGGTHVAGQEMGRMRKAEETIAPPPGINPMAPAPPEHEIR